MIDYYWAGFIAADGFIRNDRSMSICLSVKDIEHLRKFKAEYNIKNKIYVSKTTTNISMNYTNPLYLHSLKKLNITTKKSLTLMPPVNLTKQQALSFIIGYIDGDGCIGINKSDTKNSYLRLRIIGTPTFLKWINKILNGNSIPRIHCNSKISIISYNDLNILNNLHKTTVRYKLPVLARKWSKLNGISYKLLSE